jgi:hypothetical protein
MTTTSFGQVISVTGPVLGFPGTVSRQGDRVIAAREFVPTNSALNLNFGDPAVLIPNNSGGYWDSVADFVAAAASNIALLATRYAGMAVREVQTQLTYPAGQTPGILQVGYYAANTMAEVLERGNATVLLTVGAPNAGDQVYTRVVQNLSNVPGTFIGDWETNPAATDLFTTTGSGSEGSTALSIASSTNKQNNQVVSGPGVPAGAYVVSGGGTTSIVLSAPLNQAITGALITFSNLVALPDTVARTGDVDTNSVFEITLKNRHNA